MLARRLHTIQRASRWLQALLILLAVLFVINRINVLMQPVPADTRTLVGVVLHSGTITGKIQILWIAQLALAATLTLKVTYHLTRLLGLFSRGELFTAQQVAQVRQVAISKIRTLRRSKISSPSVLGGFLNILKFLKTWGSTVNSL